MIVMLISLSSSGGSLTTPADVTTDVSSGVSEVFANDVAFAALRTSGVVKCWGDARCGVVYLIRVIRHHPIS